MNTSWDVVTKISVGPDQRYDRFHELELAFDQRSDSDVASDGRLHLQIKNVFKKSSNILKTNHFRIFFDFGIMSKVK